MVLDIIMQFAERIAHNIWVGAKTYAFGWSCICAGLTVNPPLQDSIGGFQVGVGWHPTLPVLSLYPRR